MRVLIFGDIHIGSIKDTNYVYNIITDIIEKEICFTKTDLVVINGDYFHRLFKVNEEYVSLAINVMSYLVRMCKKSNTKIRLLYGTESHEMNQYKLFNYHLNSNEIDIKFIDTVTEEVIDNKNILYIPEEYINDKQEYYESYFNKKYDYIFGHGVIIEGMPMVTLNYDNKNNEKQVPRFKSKELSNISKICIFSHYHVFTNMGDNCYYLGSLFRDSFGEETPKGYGIIEDDKFMFIENTKAYIYKTYTFDENSDVYQSTDGILNEIEKIKKENQPIFDGESIGKIRFIFKMPTDTDTAFKENIRTLLNDKVITTLIKESEADLISEINEETEDEYEFILDNSLDIIDKIYRFINKEYNVEIPMQELVKYIKEDFGL